MRDAVRIFLGLAMAALVCTLLTSGRRASADERHTRLHHLASTASSGANPLVNAREESDARAVDLYGNEVDEAVAEYKLDAGGGLYETHSPQTELPRLGAPKS